MADRPGARPPRGGSVFSFAIALFCGAFLYLWMQPMVARMLLPPLGGVPSVWNTTLVFFQGALLAGYLYAHLSSRLPPRMQVLLHGALLLACIPFLPARLGPGLAPPASGSQATWLLGTLAAGFALPAVLVAATAPLLQRWFSLGKQPGSEDPYFLYAASNAGSIAALLAYPVLIEPLAGLGTQGWVWAAGFLVLAALTLWCGRDLPAAGDLPAESHPRPARGAGAARSPGEPTAREQARWLLLAAAPSSLLLGVTTHLTTDIASVPLLWVIPFALYLGTWVMAFSRRTVIPMTWLLGGQALFAVALAIVFALELPRVEKSALLFPLHLAAFVLVALVCHRQLAASRPASGHLTLYYLLLSIGGAAGGAFNALLAPVAFRSMVEYPLVLAAALLLRPPAARRTASGTGASLLREGAWPAGLFAAVLIAGLLAARAGGGHGARFSLAILGGVACLLMSSRPLRFGLAVGALMLAAHLARPPLGSVLAAERNFFGPVEVIGDSSARILYHGRTIHGAQIVDAERRRMPLAYYAASGPVGDIFGSLSPRLESARIGVIGLGSGGLAPYGQPGQEFDFYEVNPAVARMAADPRLFTYLADSPARSRILLGDGRLRLAEAPDGAYAMIIIDAFNSDAVPVHLLTREAMGVYLSKLAPGGAIVFNVTNDYLDLEPVPGRHAADLGLAAFVRNDEGGPRDGEIFKLPSDWLVVARDAADLGDLPRFPGWRRARADGPRWTDDRSSILGLFRALR